MQPQQPPGFSPELEGEGESNAAHVVEGTVVEGTVVQPPSQPVTVMSDKAAKLKELKELLDSGVLTQAEFDAEKAKVLAGSAPVAPAAPQAMVRGQAQVQVSPGAIPCPTNPAATGPYTEKWHGPNTQMARTLMFFGGCWLCCCLIAAGPGLDDRQVWTGPAGEKYLYPTGELLPAGGGVHHGHPITIGQGQNFIVVEHRGRRGGRRGRR
mmetsp:Transcript_19483/g.55426  ORF Transcript_19483/g.55426 Transcript_19483/m.55426 type:complete len:210 (-) Transcript_19483:130-759(-)